MPFINIGKSIWKQPVFWISSLVPALLIAVLMVYRNASLSNIVLSSLMVGIIFGYVITKVLTEPQI